MIIDLKDRGLFNKGHTRIGVCVYVYIHILTVFYDMLYFNIVYSYSKCIICLHTVSSNNREGTN